MLIKNQSLKREEERLNSLRADVQFWQLEARAKDKIMSDMGKK